jgi:hypothetical protein
MKDFRNIWESRLIPSYEAFFQLYFAQTSLYQIYVTEGSYDIFTENHTWGSEENISKHTYNIVLITCFRLINGKIIFSPDIIF